MKPPFIIYVQAFAVYLLLTLPTLTEPVIYIYSALYAFMAGLVASPFFIVVFLILGKGRTRANMVIYILIATIVLAVAAAYKILLLVFMPERSFSTLDTDAIFPMLAIIAGWIGLAINYRKIKSHFSDTLAKGFETIATYDKI